jgi:hypothetical protein
MNQTAGEHPDFSVVFRGDAMEPSTDVAPEGEVTLVVENQSDSAHDFALVIFEDGNRDGPPVGEPLSEGDPRLVAALEALLPGESEEVTLDLQRGRYLVISNTPGDTLGTSLFELTVQPVQGAEGDASS